LTAKKRQPQDRKTGRKSGKEKDTMLTQLKELFLMDGMTSYQASQETNYNFRTVSNYFKTWADEIIDTEGHENWIEREGRIRTRSLEGTSKKLHTVRIRLSKLQIILDDLLTLRSFTTTKDSLNAKIKKLISSLDSDGIDKLNVEIERYERIVRNNDILSSELQQQYDAIEMMPPAEAILDRELELLIAQKQAILTKTDSKQPRED